MSLAHFVASSLLRPRRRELGAESERTAQKAAEIKTPLPPTKFRHCGGFGQQGGAIGDGSASTREANKREAVPQNDGQRTLPDYRTPSTAVPLRRRTCVRAPRLYRT
ncbi:unnamed protein product, partial [Ectocarpus sp. 12 AP-2014]